MGKEPTSLLSFPTGTLFPALHPSFSLHLLLLCLFLHAPAPHQILSISKCVVISQYQGSDLKEEAYT